MVDIRVCHFFFSRVYIFFSFERFDRKKKKNNNHDCRPLNVKNDDARINGIIALYYYIFLKLNSDFKSLGKI